MDSASPGYRALLASPGVAPLFAATLAARLGTRMFTLTLILYILARFHAPALAGWATFVAIAPGLVTSPIAGALLDRLGTLRGVAVDLALGVAIMAILAIAGAHLAIAPVLVLIGLYSLTSPLGSAGIRASLPRLVPQTLWPRLNALDTATYGVVDIAGPALAGIAVATLGARIAFALIGATYAAASLCLLAVGPIAAPAPSRRGLLADIADGVVHFARHRTLRALALCYGLYHVAWGALAILVPVVATNAPGAHIRGVGAADLGGRAGNTAAGLLWSLAGAAGIVGALAAGRLAVAGQERRLLALGMIVVALAIFPLAATDGLAGLAIALVLIGLASGPIDVALITLRQRRTAPAWFPRILVLSMSLNFAGAPLGAALAGQLAHGFLPLAFAAAALAALAAAAATALIPSEVPPP